MVVYKFILTGKILFLLYIIHGMEWGFFFSSIYF